MPGNTELYILDGLIVWDVNFTSIKVFSKIVVNNFKSMRNTGNVKNKKLRVSKSMRNLY